MQLKSTIRMGLSVVGMIATVLLIGLWPVTTQALDAAVCVATKLPDNKKPSADQQQAEAQARTDGITAEWHEEFGTPRVLRGPDLGARRAFSGGKGLVAKGRSHAEDAVAVLDNLSRFYGFRDAAKEFRADRTDADKLGSHHVRLAQMHQGLRVVGGDLIVHFDKQNRAYEVNGRHVAGIDVPVAAQITAMVAEAIARKDLTSFSAGEAALVGAPVLVVYAVEGAPCLAYELELAQPALAARWRYWVNAVTGEIVQRYNDIKYVGAPTANGTPTTITGTVLAGEGGSEAAVAGWRESGSALYYLHNTNYHWQVYNLAVSGGPDLYTYAYRTNAQWGTSDDVEVSLAANFDVVQRYWRQRHGRNSFNDAGILARANAHEGTHYVNAYYDGVDFHFGDGDNTTARSLAVLDVAAHEFAHGVTDYSAGLLYSYESGALNESFSDIFGACVEFFAQPDGRTAYPAGTPGQADWLVGEDCWLRSPALRDMRNPRNLATVGAGNGQPSRYRGTYWYGGSSDNGGVHRNSGVQNFFFYLLCEGGSGDNDGVAYHVTGIGITNAEQIAYRALTLYCTPVTDYRAARAAWVSAANDLNPAWATSVVAAWGACDVGSLAVTPSANLSFGGLEGGPFQPTAQSYALANADPSPCGWTSSVSQAWLTLSPASGTVPASGSSEVQVSINSAAATLAAGTYTAAVVFSNTVDGLVVTRTISLLVGAPDSFTELFSDNDNDLHNLSLTFTPDGSASYYTVGRWTATNFPVDPAGGTPLNLADDGFTNLTLTGGATVWLYGTNYAACYVGANGYITFGAGDTAFAESLEAHFRLPRIAALFDDLSPAPGQVNWKQLADRLAVTWQNVPQFGLADTNSFQIELFFDGRLRITWLQIAATDGLAGLSRGQNVPAEFTESDLSGYNLAPPDALNVLTFGSYVGAGRQGGPFTPAGKSYTLTNSSAGPVSWVAVPSAAWLTATPASGTLSPGASTNVTVAPDASANALLYGVYHETMAFSNSASGVASVRLAQLTVNRLPGEIEVLDSIAPATDLTLAFSNVIAKASRTETITITNRSATGVLVVSNIFLDLPHASFAPAGLAQGAGAVSAAPTVAPSAVPCYGISLASNTLVSFSSDTPGSLTTISTVSGNLWALTFLANDVSKLYALDALTGLKLVTLDIVTGAQTTIGLCAPATSHYWTGLAGAPDGTLYASAVNYGGTASKLYQVNPATGDATLIGDINNASNIVSIVINAAGQLYGVDVTSDKLIAINTATGAGTVVGGLGVDATSLGGMAFDQDNGILYWAAYTTAAALRVIDTTTGASTLVGAFPGGAMEMAVVNEGGSVFQLPNLPSMPLEILPGQSVTFQVQYAPLMVKTRLGEVVIQSNDLDEPEVRVQLTGVCRADYLQVSSASALSASGHVGGVFSPASISYSVSNAGPSALTWTAVHTQAWVSVTPNNGTLAAGASVSVAVTIAAAANNLLAGVYKDVVTFSNVTSGVATQQRAVTLRVTGTPQMTVAPASLAVTLAYGAASNVTLQVANQAGADGKLAFALDVWETSRAVTALGAASSAGLGRADAGRIVDPLATAAAAAAELRPPPDRDFTRVQSDMVFTTNRLLVRFAPGTPTAQRDAAIVAAGGGEVVRAYRIVPGLCLVQLPEGTTVEAALALFNGQPGVLYAEPDYERHIDADVTNTVKYVLYSELSGADNTVLSSTTPNDPYFSQMWGLQSIAAPDAWATQTGSRRVVVAVIDSGIDYNHPDLAANIWTNPGEIPNNGIDDDGNGYVDDVHGYDFANDDGNPWADLFPNHGTAVASTIGAVGNNGRGVAGVCWQTSIMALKIFIRDPRNGMGYARTADAIAALEYATLMGARLTCNSWDGGGYDQSLKDAIDAAGAAEVAVIATSSDDYWVGHNTDLVYPCYPACYDSSNIISVIASDASDALWNSNYGLTTTDLAAPCYSYCSMPNNGYEMVGGVWVATAYAAGAYALLLSANPDLTVREAKAALMDTVDPIAGLSGLCASGGRLNVARALRKGGVTWLSVAPDGATDVVPGATVPCTLHFDAAAMEAGTYAGQVIVTGNDPLHLSVTVPVTLTVLPESLGISPGGIATNSGTLGGPFTPGAQIYTLTNRTSAPLNWTLNHMQAWLSLSASSGALAAYGSQTITATVNVAASLLYPGYHTDILNFSNATSGAVQHRMFELAVQPAPLETIHYIPLNTNPGWSCEGQWAFGQPQGREGDPASGHTGNNVFGYNLAGTYSSDMPAYYLTSTAYDCTGYKNVKLNFWRWLGVWFSGWYQIQATVEASNDGVHWVMVWNCSADYAPIEDTYWRQVQYDISEVADGQPRVYLRWSMGPHLSEALRCGWNIDDIALLGERADRMVVLPLTDFAARGCEGGPFAPATNSYTLVNLSTSNAMAWTATSTQAWLTVTPASGTLDVGATTTVSVAVNAAAATLAVGTYVDSVVISNQVTGFVQRRSVQLEVLPVPGEIAVTDSVSPADDRKVPFGDVIVGLSQTQRVTITNADLTHTLVVTNLQLCPAAPSSYPSIAGVTHAPSQVLCYGVDLSRGKLVSFFSDTPSMQTDIGDCANSLYALEFLNGDFRKLYALDNATKELVTLDTATGARTVIGACVPAGGGETWTGLAASPDGVLYASAAGAYNSPLYTIDPASGAATQVGDIGYSFCVIAIAMNAAGQLYGVEVNRDNLLSINPATGAGTVIGTLGVDANYAQGMDFDEESGVLYWAACTVDDGGAALRVIDTTTGASSLVSGFPNGSEMEMAIAAGGGAFQLLHWPTLPYTLAPGAALTLDIRYQPTTVRSNRAALVISSTDLSEPTVRVELSGNSMRDYLRVAPTNAFVASGHHGGPFAPASAVYALSNAGPVAVQWSASCTQNWLSLTPASGTLAAGATTTVTVAFTAAAESLSSRTHTAQVLFSNLTTTIQSQALSVGLTVFTTPSIQVGPLALVVTNRVGQSAKRVLTISNAAGADAPLDMQLYAYETGRGSASLAGGVEALASDADPLAVAAAAARSFRPPVGRDFTQLQRDVAFKAGRLLVRFEPGATGQARASALQGAGGGTVVREYTLVPGLCTVDLPPGQSVAAALRTFNGQSGILYAEPVYAVHVDATPNDTRFAELWGMNNIGQTGGTTDADIDATEAWNVKTGSRNIVVAVIDTGVDYTHVDLAANIWTNPGEIPDDGLDNDGNGFIDDVHGWDFCNDDNDPMDDFNPVYHGTHVAGTIGAVGNNGIGVAGVCWNVRIMALKFIDNTGNGYTDDGIAAIEYATRMRAKLTSNSWGGSGYNQALKDAIDAAGAANIACIAAAGNSYLDADSFPNYPACYDSANIISVVATDHNDAKPAFSSYGLTSTDLGAPGVNILSCKPGNSYQLLSGTSMATPHVAGAYALLLSANPALPVARVKAALLDTVDPIPALTGLCVTGGRLNVSKALARVGSPWLTVDPGNASDVAPGGATYVTAFFDASTATPGSYTGVVEIACNDRATPTIKLPAVMVVLADYPLAPTGLTATASATNRIELAWTDNASNETGYVVYRSPDSHAWMLVTLTTANATNCSDSALATNTLYYYRVAASNAAGLSAYCFATGMTWSAYEQWRHGYFSGLLLANAAISGATADPDHDGLNNQQEYWAGTDPTNASSCLTIEAFTNNPVAVGGGFVVSWQSVEARVYAVQAATNLITGFTNLATGLLATPPLNIHTDTTVNAWQMFYRVWVDIEN